MTQRIGAGERRIPPWPPAAGCRRGRTESNPATTGTACIASANRWSGSGSAASRLCDCCAPTPVLRQQPGQHLPARSGRVRRKSISNAITAAPALASLSTSSASLVRAARAIGRSRARLFSSTSMMRDRRIRRCSAGLCSGRSRTRSATGAPANPGRRSAPSLPGTKPRAAADKSSRGGGPVECASRKCRFGQRCAAADCHDRQSRPDIPELSAPLRNLP